MAVNQKGEVIVTEVDGYSILVFSPDGGKLLSFGTLGSDQGHFSHLRGVAMDDEGNILVVDSAFKSSRRKANFLQQFVKRAVGT